MRPTTIMKVHELIKQLQKKDQEAIVLLYVYEDFNRLRHIHTNTTELYCKGYSFEEFKNDNPNTSFIILED